MKQDIINKKIKSFVKKLNAEGYAKLTVKNYKSQSGRLLSGNIEVKSKSNFIVKKSVEKKLLEYGIIEKSLLPDKNRKKTNRENHIRKKLLDTNSLDTILTALECKSTEYKLIVELALYTGLRLAELMALTGNDIRFDNDTQMYIIHTTGKGDKDRDVFVINPSDYLKNWLDNSSSFSGFTLKRATLESTIQRLKKKLNIKFSMHSYRHTLATNMLSMGFMTEDVQEQLGHTNIATTQIYSKLTMIARKERMKKVLNNNAV